jgi:phospholipid-binding lipoprotein MlaA
MLIKNLNKIFISLTIVFLLISGAKTADECFENASRGIFKFNMAFDDIVLEPISKGYNKLPDPIKTGTSKFTSNIGILLSIPNNILQ